MVQFQDFVSYCELIELVGTFFNLRTVYQLNFAVFISTESCLVDNYYVLAEGGHFKERPKILRAPSNYCSSNSIAF